METHTAVVCPACACVCDDLTLRIEGGTVLDVAPRCPLAEAWFRDQSRPVNHSVEVDGQPTSLEAGLQRAAEVLQAANYPLIYGLSRSSTPGQRAAVHLAESLRGVIDTTASLCHGPSIMAKQAVGEVTCTLGEVRNRCDLVIFWGCNPADTHPRHAERYSVLPRGRFVTGRESRTVVMVGDARYVHAWRLDRAGERPDVVVPIIPGSDFEALTALRMLVKELPIVESKAACGAKPEHLHSLADRMKAARSGVVFFGLGLTDTSIDRPTTTAPQGHLNVECLLRLVAELNEHTRFYARRMRLLADVSGADTVLTWQTGFPFSVDFMRGYPRYNPVEFSAYSLLERGEVDAVLLVGTETLPAFSATARQHLASLPTIVLDNPAAKPNLTPSVHFTTAPYGLSAAGTIYRMDEVPLTLRSYQDSPWPTDEYILRSLVDAVRRGR